MPRRRKSSPLDDMIELVSMLPWWAGAVMAPICYVLLHAWAVRVGAEMTTKPQITSGLHYALASIGQYLLPSSASPARPCPRGGATRERRWPTT